MASRTALIERAREHLQRISAPRVEMLLIMLLTAGTGLLTSFVLLHAGVLRMPLRYPLAVLVAYGAFLVYLWIWLSYRQTYKTSGGHRDPSWDDWDVENDAHDDSETQPHRRRGYDASGWDGDLSGIAWIPGGKGSSGGGGFSGRGGRFSGGGAGGSFGEKSTGWSLKSLSGDSDGDSDSGGGLGPVLLLLVVIALLVFMTSYVIYIAPGLLAEVFVDGALAAGLYRHLRHGERRHWLATAFRRTWWYFLSVAVLLGLAGVVMEAYSPGAVSIGEVDFGPMIDDLIEILASLGE